MEHDEHVHNFARIPPISPLLRFRIGGPESGERTGSCFDRALPQEELQQLEIVDEMLLDLKKKQRDTWNREKLEIIIGDAQNAHTAPTKYPKHSDTWIREELEAAICSAAKHTAPSLATPPAILGAAIVRRLADSLRCRCGS